MNDTRSNLDYRNNNNVKREKDNLISNSFQCLSWNKFRLSVASSNRHCLVENPTDLQQTKVFIFWMISKCSLWETVVLCKDRWDQSAHNIFLLFSILSFRIFSPLSVSFFLWGGGTICLFSIWTAALYSECFRTVRAIFLSTAHPNNCYALWHLIQLIASMKITN